MDGLKPIIDALTGFGTAAPALGLILWLYWQERSERKEMAVQIVKLLSDAIEAEKDMTAALNVLSAKVTK